MVSPGVGVDPKRVQPREVRFVLQTSGSRAGLIDGAKRKIRPVANDVVGVQPEPKGIRIALLGYRGNVDVTTRFDLRPGTGRGVGRRLRRRTSGR